MLYTGALWLAVTAMSVNKVAGMSGYVSIIEKAFWSENADDCLYRCVLLKTITNYESIKLEIWLLWTLKIKPES